MTAQVVPFTFQEHHPVRVTIISDEPWFCLSDVCAVLNVDRTSDLLRKLDEKGVVKNPTLTQGGEQQLKFVNEPNMYRVIFRSNKPEAKAFQDWVFNEVLPAIRKTGRYEHPAPQPTLNAEQRKVIRQLIDGIICCCRAHERANFAVNERLRLAHGLRTVAEMRPEHFEEAKTELESLRALSEQHQNRMIALDEEFITAVLRPPVSIRKVRAMARKQAAQPPLTF